MASSGLGSRSMAKVQKVGAFLDATAGFAAFWASAPGSGAPSPTSRLFHAHLRSRPLARAIFPPRVLPARREYPDGGQRRLALVPGALLRLRQDRGGLHPGGR